jgi:carbonic anhydrase
VRTLNNLFENNRRWAKEMERQQPGFFPALAAQQAPQYLWIGCSDSRVPANEIVGLLPGELFVHRNVANIVLADDGNCMSVVRYAVDVLKVRHIIVCGHYGCGGVEAAAADVPCGIDQWLRPIRQIAQQRRELLEHLPPGPRRLRRLCEVNVLEQVRSACFCEPVADAWRRGQELSVHGWVYDIRDGLLRDLGACVRSCDEVESLCDAALRRLAVSPGISGIR